MPKARDAIVVLTNLLYLIEKHAHDEDQVRKLARQAGEPLRLLTTLHEEEIPANDTDRREPDRPRGG